MMNCALLVESDLRTRRHIETALKEECCEVKAFPDATVALEAVDRGDVRADVAVIAWDLDGPVSGSEFLLRLQQRKLPFPCLIVTSLIDLEMHNRARALGAADVLLKPIDADRLRKAVRTALKDPREVDPLVARLRESLIGDAPKFVEAVVKLSQAIHSVKEDPTTSILLIGESGVGKEVFARCVHNETCGNSARLEPVNIAGLSPTLIESELFGHEKGAFTDAHCQRKGAFEQAGNGTLFLDEIGDLLPSLQPKLLRAIEQRCFTRVGGAETVELRARLVCATSHNLTDTIKTEAFREDLYYRISEYEIRIPPLRERPEDLRPLIRHFLDGSEVRLERETRAMLESYSFPGNVRELQKVIKRARAVCRGGVILPADLEGEIMLERERQPVTTVADVAQVEKAGEFVWPERLFKMYHGPALDDIEKAFDRVYLLKRIEEAGGNREKAATLMKITPKTLRERLRACGLGHMVRNSESEPE